MKKQQLGFAHLFVILAVVVAVIVGAGLFVMSRNSTNTAASNHDGRAQQSAEPEADIALQNFGIDTLDNVDVTTNAVREYASKGLKGFYVFGDKLGGKEDARKNPNFEFSSLKPGTNIISSIDGIVAFIKEQPDSKDSEVFIQPREHSAWTVGYDHVVGIVVKKGEPIHAGDVIGQPAVQNNGLLRFEMQINKDADGVTTHYCPSVLLDTAVREGLLGSLASMQNRWESVTGLDLYDSAGQDPVGCLGKTMTVAEAEGR